MLRHTNLLEITSRVEHVLLPPVRPVGSRQPLATSVFLGHRPNWSDGPHLLCLREVRTCGVLRPDKYRSHVGIELDLHFFGSLFSRREVVKLKTKFRI